MYSPPSRSLVGHTIYLFTMLGKGQGTYANFSCTSEIRSQVQSLQPLRSTCPFSCGHVMGAKLLADYGFLCVMISEGAVKKVFSGGCYLVKQVLLLS